MQTLLVCLTILASATTDWSQYCNGNIVDAIIPPPSVQLYLQDQLVETQPTGREIVRWMQIKPPEQSYIVRSVRTVSSPKGACNAPLRPIDVAAHQTIDAGAHRTSDVGAHRTSDVGPHRTSDVGAHRPSHVSVAEPLVASAPKSSQHESLKTSLVSKPTQGSNSKSSGVKNSDAKSKTAASDDDKIEASLPQISKMTILHHFDADENDGLKGLPLEKLADKFVVKSEHKKNAGLFITLIKNGDTRACWGSVNSSQRNLVLATIYTTEDALAKDYRYSKIKKSEINQLIPQVTVVKKIIPINSIVSMQPLKQGLMVRAGGKGAVLLPGEASDPHYQLVKTKLKAGIPMSQPCQLYRIEADVYR